MLTCFQTSVISSSMFLMTMAANLLSANLAYSAIKQTIGWMDWAKAAIVPRLVSLIVVPLLMYLVYPPTVKSSPDAPNLAREKLEKMGPMSQSEIIMPATLLLTSVPTTETIHSSAMDKDDSSSSSSSSSSSRSWMTSACLSFVISCTIAITFQILLFSPISPDSLHLPPGPTSSFHDLLPTNKHLQRVIKLGQGLLDKPEDVCIDDEKGLLYTATRDGWVRRLHYTRRNGSTITSSSSWEDWKLIHSNALLGITTTAAGDLIVCDAHQGLLKVGEDGVAVLAAHVNGTKIRFADDVIEAADGSLYFSVASTKFGLENWYLDVLEAKPHGQLLKYDPSLNHTSLVLDGLHFANGVALSADQTYLVVCETWKFRCLKYWLSGEDQGKTQIFVDNLPGGPDNINLAPDGSFWIALLELTAGGFEFVHTSKAVKQILVTTFPGLILKRVLGMHRKASVVKVGSDGKIITKLDDPDGLVMSFVTSALEFDDHLYLGSLNSDFLGKLPLRSF